jgi:hypothetical protein
VAVPGAGNAARSSVVSISILRQDKRRQGLERITMPIVVDRNRDIRGRSSVQEAIILIVGLVNRAKEVFVLLVFVE